jgi:hypothetical protein
VIRLSALVAVLALSGCGGGGTSAGTAPSVPSTRDPRCTNVPPAVATEIAAKLTVPGELLRHAQAVKSFDYETPTYFVSAIVGSDTGTWATSKLEPGGTIYAVDDIAKKDSKWPAGDTSSTYVSMIDDGAELSRDCVTASG